MEFNENASRLYFDPNAYIQNHNEQQKKKDVSRQSTPQNLNIYPADNPFNIQNFNFSPASGINNSRNQASNFVNFNNNFSPCNPHNPPNKNKSNCKNGQFYCQKPPQKVVFSEPYESVPNFYLNNNFKKGSCACNPKPKPKCPPPKPPFSFDLKNILPLLSGLLKNNSGAGGVGNILSILNQNSNGENSGANLDFSSIISTLSNNGGLDSILNLFKPKNKTTSNSGLFRTNNNSNATKQTNEISKSNDFVIKNYTRVE